MPRLRGENSLSRLVVNLMARLFAANRFKKLNVQEQPARFAPFLYPGIYVPSRRRSHSDLVQAGALLQAARRSCCPSRISSVSLSQKASRSPGLRLVTSPWSATT